jgi:hypothetical protein
MGGEDRLFNRNHPNLIVPYIDEWASITLTAHCEDGTRVPKAQTLPNVAEKNWLLEGNRHGIPKPYIIELINP